MFSTLMLLRSLAIFKNQEPRYKNKDFENYSSFTFHLKQLTTEHCCYGHQSSVTSHPLLKHLYYPVTSI